MVVPHQPSGISGQLTTRHERNGEQSMVNRMNRLLGCSLATAAKERRAYKLIAVSDYVCMKSDRLLARANRMSVEKSALREFNSRALDLSHKGSDCLMSAP